MITPEQIAERARRWWSSGQVMRAWLTGEPAFPWTVPFRRPSAKEWLDGYTQLRVEVARLEAESKGAGKGASGAAIGSGYTLMTSNAEHQKLGRLRVIDAIVFDSAEDVAAAAGETAALRRFQRLARELRDREPRLVAWMTQKPFALLEHETALPRALAVARHLALNARPLRYARELGIAGVDSKFIEAHRVLLADWLDCLLPAGAIDESARGFSDYGFERRFGLRYEEPSVRFRWLDRSQAAGGALVDMTVPLPQFATYAPACARVFVTENKISFLTLPECANSLVIFGGGYAIDRLASVHWMGNQPLYYWGDIDTHGFAILSRLRGHWPSTRTFLMDRETLMSHRELWSEEPEGGRFLSDLPGLDGDETALFDDLRRDALGVRVRLEQERVTYDRIETAVALVER